METRREFNQTLQRLRKQSGLTQEQLAERLYVSRTAVSKWETGGGYPGLETLVAIAELFDVSVDDLLSGAEVVGVAEEESRASATDIFAIAAGILDMAAALLLVLPLFGVPKSDGALIVPLFEYCSITQFGFAFVVLIVPLVLVGGSAVGARLMGRKRLAKCMLAVSAAIHVLAVLLLAAARQPYATAFLFMLFVAKAAIALYAMQRTRS